MQRFKDMIEHELCHLQLIENDVYNPSYIGSLQKVISTYLLQKQNNSYMKRK